MHGLGNDFIVIDRVTHPEIILSSELAKKLGDRHFWIWCDQILIIEPSETHDFRYRIYNQDGSEVEMCGNGARCFYQYVIDVGLTKQDTVRVEIAKWELILRQYDTLIEVDMGSPLLTPRDIPVIENIRMLHVIDRDFIFTPVSMGNPHAVIFLEEDITSFPLEKYWPLIENMIHIFPKKVNVEYINILSKTAIYMRVWERGAGETLACGTGACAAVVAGIQAWYLTAWVPIRVNLLGGSLFIRWNGWEKDHVLMSGPATKVFDGTYYEK